MYNKVITIEWGRGYYGKGRCDLTHNLNATYVESGPWLSTLGGIGPNQDIDCWFLLEPLQLVILRPQSNLKNTDLNVHCNNLCNNFI